LPPACDGDPLPALLRAHVPRAGAALDAHRDHRGGAGGRELLDVLVAIEFAAIYLLLPPMLAASIAGEKERGSLELLLVTDLGPWEIVLEKLLGRVFPMATFLLLSLPLMALAYSLGGVTPEYIASAVWHLLLACLQVGAVAIFFSALCGNAVSALIATYVVGAGMYALGGALFSPPALYRLSDQPLAEGTYFNLVVSFLLLAGASVALRRRAAARSGNLLVGLFRGLDRVYDRLNRRLGGIVLLRDRPMLPGNDPVAWRETEKRALGNLRYLARILLVLEVPVVLGGLIHFLGSWRSWWSGGQVESFSVLVFILWGIAALALLVTGIAAIHGERARGTLEVLLTTPMTGREIVLQKHRGLWRLQIVLAVPLLTVFVMESVAESWTVFGALPYLVASTITVLLGLPVLSWISIWMGLAIRGRLRAFFLGLLAIAFWAFCPASLLPAGFIWVIETQEVRGDGFVSFSLLHFWALVNVGWWALVRHLATARSDRLLGRC
jgi:ABC-type Na+ efflux pump permease subunit